MAPRGVIRCEALAKPWLAGVLAAVCAACAADGSGATRSRGGGSRRRLCVACALETSNVQRSIFMDDFVYSIAPDVLRVQQLSDMRHDVASLPWR
jgi:hypothetical protein